MKLRARFLSGFALILVLVAGLGVAVVFDQRDQLIDQLDRRLVAVAPLDRPAPSLIGVPPPPGGVERDREAQISDVFIAAVDGEGTVEVLLEGQLLSDVPDLDALVDVAARRTGS